jgi:hypothetical protein
MCSLDHDDAFTEVEYVYITRSVKYIVMRHDLQCMLERRFSAL